VFEFEFWGWLFVLKVRGKTTDGYI
jgi:hypothetical protein